MLVDFSSTFPTFTLVDLPILCPNQFSDCKLFEGHFLRTRTIGYISPMRVIDWTPGVAVLLSLLILSDATGTSPLTDHLASSRKFQGLLSLYIPCSAVV